MSEELTTEEYRRDEPCGFRIDDLVEKAFGGIMNKMRNFVSPQRFELLGNLLERLGYYAVIASVLVGLVMVIGVKVKGGAFNMPEMRNPIFFVLLALPMLYITVKFSRWTRQLVADNPSRLPSRTIPDAMVLLALAFGVAVFLFNLLLFCSGEANFMLPVTGFMLLLLLLFLSGFPLLAETANITFEATGSTADTALAVLRFAGKLVLKAAPAVFGLLAILGLIAMLIGIYMLFCGTNQEYRALQLDSFVSQIVMYAIWLPALAVGSFLLLYLVLDWLEAMLKRNR